MASKTPRTVTEITADLQVVDERMRATKPDIHACAPAADLSKLKRNLHQDLNEFKALRRELSKLQHGTE